MKNINASIYMYTSFHNNTEPEFEHIPPTLQLECHNLQNVRTLLLNEENALSKFLLSYAMSS